MERVGTTSATVIDEVEQNLARGTTPVLPACGRTFLPACGRTLRPQGFGNSDVQNPILFHFSS